MPTLRYAHRVPDPRFAPRLLVFVALLGLAACDGRSPSIKTLQAAGELRVALVSVPHTYYLESEGILGFDYELLREFCRALGVRLVVTMVDTRQQAKMLVAKRKVHLAAGLIPVPAAADQRIRYGPSYSLVQAQVIYLSGKPRPLDTAALVGAKIETLAGGVGETELTRLARTAPDLRWTTRSASSTERLLARLNAGVIDYAVVPSTDFMVMRSKYPRLEVGFDLGQLHATAWALSTRSDA
ncbi:MAG: transporter substrate-binding domain-containing protein, partial [Gammaproteobacteria bacterium]|nr:transporter substrate-binding domain-containing protein [Gammaproteobacteria bacterium]